MTDTAVVVLGAGLAGSTAAKALRAQGHTGSITLIGAEPGAPYRRPAVSKDLLAGTATAESIVLDKPEAFDGIDTRFGSTATALDTRARTVTLDDGSVLDYHALVIATGSAPRPWPTGNVRTLRTAGDVPGLRDALAKDPSLIVIGGGLIGCEVAATAVALGVAVTVLENATSLLARIVPAEVSDAIRALHLSHGVSIETGVDITGVDRIDDRSVVTTADGRTWSAGTTLASIGTVPSTTLAADAGIEIGSGPVTGIIVDHHFRTSADGVYAIGDVAAVPNPLLGGRYRSEHWNGAAAQGKAVACAVLGHDPGVLEVPWGWSTQYGENLQFAGWAVREDEWTVDGSVTDHTFIATAHRDGAIVGAVAMGRPRDLRAARTAMAGFGSA